MRVLFARAACGVIVFLPLAQALADGTGPNPGVYQFTGSVATSTPAAVAAKKPTPTACPAHGQAVSGEIVLTKGQNDMVAHFASSTVSPALAFTFKRQNDTPLLQFGVETTGSMDYEVFPGGQILPGTFSMRPTAGTDSSNFSLTLNVKTGSLNTAVAGACNITYSLSFKTGLSPKITNFLKSVL